MDRVIAKPWLSLQCGMIPGVRHAAFAADPSPSGDFATLEAWPEGSDPSPGLMATLRDAMEREDVVVVQPGERGDTGECWVIATPLRQGGACCGAAAVAVEGLEPAQVPVVTQLMRWGSAWPAFLADQQRARPPEAGERALALVAALLETEGFAAATAAAATALAEAFGAARAGIGVQGRRGVEVLGLSGRASFDARSNPLRRLQAAMNEACDQDAAVVLPRPQDAGAVVSEAHARLSAVGEDGAVCTVPMHADGAVLGALTLVRGRSRPFEPGEVARLEAFAAAMGPAIAVRRRADRGVIRRAADSGAELLGRVLGRGHLRTKALLALAVGSIAFLTLATGTHELQAPGELAGVLERELVAPRDGYLAEASVRAGARVRAGEVLATLDDRALQLERRRWQSEREKLGKEHDRALGELDRSATRILEAQIAQAEARLALVEEELERTRVLAPFDGIVVSGDLGESIGRPLSRGDPLFRLAPLEGYRVVLEVDEADVPMVVEGTTGRLALAALPGERFDIRVERLNGLTRSVEGRNAMEVEAALLGHSEHFRPGMKGAARLDAGEASLLWIWTHRLIDRLRLWLWAFSPVV